MRCFTVNSAALFAVAAITWSFSGTAEPLALNRGLAVELALRQNPQIAAARAVEAQAAAHGDQASAAGLPNVSLAAAFGPSITSKLVPGSAAQSTRSSTDIRLKDLSVVVGGELQILQPLYTFGKISERQRAASFEHKAREAQTSLTRADVAFDAASYYEAHLFARDAERFFQEMERWLKRNIESTEAELETDSGPTEQDLLRLGTAMGVVHMGLHQAETVKLQTAGALQAYLALDTGLSIEPVEETLELLPTVTGSLNKYVQLALRDRAELRGARAATSAFEALATAEEAGNYPDFFALASLSAAYTPGRQWLPSRYLVDPLNHLVPVLLVGARWQWNGGMATARGAESRAQALEFQHKARWAETAIPAEVNKAFQNVQRAYRDAEAAQGSVTLAKKWMVQASADYSVGASDSRNVAEAAQAYVQMRIANFDARYRHNVALAELAKVTGTLDVAENPFYPSSSANPSNPAPVAPSPAEPAATPATKAGGKRPNSKPNSDPVQAETPDPKRTTP